MDSVSSRYGRPLVALAVLLAVADPMAPAVITVGGGCNLASAITSANEDAAFGSCATGSGADELRLTGNVLLPAPLPLIDSDMTIVGNGFTIRRDPGAADFRIFEVDFNDALTLDNVVVSGGVAVDGGGIRNDGTLTVRNSALVDNVATFRGGAIQNFGTAVLEATTISGNSAVTFGGGVQNYRSMIITDSRIEDNHADSRGGGIHQGDGTLTITGSTISGNTVTGSTAGGGGGLFTHYSYSPGVSLINSTISGNSVGAGKGGGIYNYYVFQLSLTNTTVAENVAPAGTAHWSYYSTTTVANSVLSGTCGGNYQPVDGGNNFGCGLGVLTGLDPVLADNGGPTPTHALEAGSSAIDAAGACAEAADQRGFGRSGDCDSGAFEFDGVRPAVGGSSSGVQTSQVFCHNRSTGSSVAVPLGGATSWDCEAAGLIVDRGDVVQQVLVGKAESATTAITGSLGGMRLDRVVCRNNTLASSTEIRPAGLGTSWDCSAAGLGAGAGDRIRVTATGTGD